LIAAGPTAHPSARSSSAATPTSADPEFVILNLNAGNWRANNCHPHFWLGPFRKPTEGAILPFQITPDDDNRREKHPDWNIGDHLEAHSIL
jgi:hypothetical protein